MNLNNRDKYVALSNLSIYYKRNKFKITSPTSNDKSELPDGSYSVSNIQDYLLSIISKSIARCKDTTDRIE